MQIKIFSVSVLGGEDEEERLNLFLRSHKVADVRRELVQTDSGCFWTFCISYMLGASPSLMSEKKEKTDYKQVLDEHSFSRFAKMREIRKQLAAEDAVPAYLVFTDAELAEFAKVERLTLGEMKKVNGVGEKRMEKYGEKFLSQYEKEGKPDTAGSGVGELIDSLF